MARLSVSLGFERRRTFALAICAPVLMAVFAGSGAAQAAVSGPVVPISAPVAGVDYKIGFFDKLTINVFGVKDLALDSVQVDAGGQIQLPLIGALQAKGKTSRELSDEIARRLNERYLRDAQVSVVVASSANQKITVEGAVTAAGVFEIPGRMTLLQAVALAKGPTNRADLKHVSIFRDVDGKQDKLIYDVGAIEAGHFPDPVMQGNDVVVVSESPGLSAFREIVGDIGAFSIFAIFR